MLLDPRKVRLVRWFAIVDSIREARADDELDRLRHGSFAAWQIVTALVGTKAVGSFGSYWQSLGLERFTETGGRAESVRTRKPVGLVSAEEAMANAERTLQHFRDHPRRVLGRGATRAARERRRRGRRQRREALK